MIPSELKLTSLGHCYVHLPETFVSRQPAVVSIKSIQSDHELIVMWDGHLTSGEHVELDFDFGQANNFKDELVIISSIDDIELNDCSSCRVKLLNSSDYAILSQHTEANVLDTCRLISVGLVIPIFISQHVKILVRVVKFEPSDKPLAMLTKWTEVAFVHDLTELPKSSSTEGLDSLQETIDTKYSSPFLSCALGSSQYKPRFHLGSLLICGGRGAGKTYHMKKILDNYKLYYTEYFNCKQLRGKRPENVKKTFNELMSRAKESARRAASIIALDDIDSFLEFDPKLEDEKGQEVLYKKRLVAYFCHFLKQLERTDANDYPVNGSRLNILLIASCRSLESLDKRISNPTGRQYFNEIIHVNPLDMNDRVEMLKNLLRENRQHHCSLDNDSKLEEVARKCSSFTPSDMMRLYERALISACSRSYYEFNSEPVTVQMDDFLESIDGYTPINLRTVSLQSKAKLRSFDQIGGMEGIKDALCKTVLLPIKYPKLYKKCPLKSQCSILLFGPPGCGKTMIAEALCNQEGLNSICVRGPQLLSKYIGASEASVRDLFKRAQLARPCVIFFDEFESLVARRGADSTGVTDRVVNQFLTILDGVDSLGDEVFIIAATSRPDMIDPAMLRPGRLDHHIYCPLPNEQDRQEILKILSKSIDLHDDIDLVEWARKLNKFSGADIQSLLCSAQLKALNELIGGVDKDVSDSGSANCSKKQDFVINVKQKHMVESYEEMRETIDLNHSSLLEKYPPTINRLGKQRVAIRATLT